jgi:2-desacetyl-2-hydroxyethyl bacteriochlorophyllide A dehydrogenase
MKAVVYDGDGGLVVRDVPKPEVGMDGVLLKVSHVGFCGSDHHMIESRNLSEGYILGHEVSGTVAELGSEVRDVEIGARVVIRPTFCGECPECKAGKPYMCVNDRRALGIGTMNGAFAEYVLVYPQMLIPVPDGVDSRNAALAEAFSASLHGIRCSEKTGGSALVIGGGAIGLALVRLLKVMGFGPVALSEPVEAKRSLARQFGADMTVNPLENNLVLYTFEQTGGRGFDVVYECSGVAGVIQDGMNSVARGGVMCIVSMIMKDVSISPMVLNFKEIWLTGSYSNTHEENRECLKWMAQGKIDGRPLITEEVTLDELPEVYRERIATAQAIKVMIRVGESF